MDEQHAYTGFPSPAEEYRRPALNLHHLLAPRPLFTFFARFAGDAMVEANICDQDLLVIERLGDYSNGQIVLAFVDGQRLVRRLEKREGRLFLCPANNRYSEIELDCIFRRIVKGEFERSRKVNSRVVKGKFERSRKVFTKLRIPMFWEFEP